jgi:hypothetical protein
MFLSFIFNKSKRKEEITVKRFFKKIFGFLFLATLCLANIKAATYSNKTFLMPRPVGVNMAMEYTTWHKILFNNPPENQFGANFEVTGFYQDSDNKKDLGKYFGVNKKHDFVIGDATKDVKFDYIFHAVTGHDTTSAKVEFNPNQKAYGARLDYYQDLCFILKGLYLKANTPFVKIENNMHMDIDDATDLFANNNLEKYFKGKYIQEFDSHADVQNMQTNLKKAKIHGEQSTEGFADVDVILGYKGFDEERYQIKFNLGLTIPTGNDVKGESLFEAIRGNGRHWGFGGGFDAQVDLYKKNHWTIRLINAYNYRYLFESFEKRTLGLNKTFRDQINFSQYFLLGKVSAEHNQNLIPAANILTTKVDVTPGSQLDGILSLDFIYKNFVFDLGYNLFFREHESLELNEDPFGDDQYGVAEPSFNTANAFTQTAAIEDHLLTIHDLDLKGASTPSLLTHKLYGGLGWAMSKKGYSALLGIGGSYEFATSNCDLETWALWAKFGVSF